MVTAFEDENPVLPTYDAELEGVVFTDVSASFTVFDGANTGMEGEFTLFLVVRTTDAVDAQPVLGRAFASFFADGFAITYEGVEGGGYRAFALDEQHVLEGADTELHLIRMTYDGEVLVSSLDGSTPPVQGRSLLGRRGESDLDLGAVSAFDSDSLQDSIHELRVFRRNLSDEEVGEIEVELAEKWGIPLDVDHASREG